MQRISSSESTIPIPRPSDSDARFNTMSPTKSFDVEKSTGRRPSIVEIFADPFDELDPQNWKPWRKRLVFIALMSSSILCDGCVVPESSILTF